MKTPKGFRFEVTQFGKGEPTLCVRAADHTEAEKLAAEALGCPWSRVVAARCATAARKAGRFVSK